VQEATVLTFATHVAFEFCAFYRSALIHGISPKLLGWDTAPEGALHRKATSVAAEIAEYDDGRIVLFADAFDVLFLDPLPGIVERFRAIGKPILFSAEKGCYPSWDLAVDYPKPVTPWSYLNSGAYIGYAGPLKAMLREMLALPSVREDAMDQELATLVYLYGSSAMAIDHRCEVFMNLHLSQWDLEWTGKRYRNRVTGTLPSILHFNGNAKNDQRRFSRRLGYEKQPVDASLLGSLEGDVLLHNCSAGRRPRPQSLRERFREFRWPVQSGLAQLNERLGRPPVAGWGGQRLARFKKLVEQAVQAAARRGIILSDVPGSSLRDQYYRNIYRRRILESPPMSCGPGDGEFDVRIVTCEADYLDALWALKTFLAFSGRRPHVVIHDDGSLSPLARTTLARHLVGARFILRDEADREIAASLRGYPRCARFRARTRPNGLKLLDLALLGCRRPFILLDSDVLFFRAPEELLAHADARRPCFMSDGQNAYSFPLPELEEVIGRSVLERVNSGLMYVDAELLDLDLLERYFGLAQGAGRISWLAWQWLEQTGWALLLSASRRGVARLSMNYQISQTPISRVTVSHHFVNDGSRIDFYDRGLRRLRDDQFLDRLARGDFRL